jgi:hypothetical protein
VVHFRNRMPVVPDDGQFAGGRGLSTPSSSGAHGVNGVQLGVIRDQTVGYVGFGSIESVS